MGEREAGAAGRWQPVIGPADLCGGGESSGPPAATDMARCHLLMIWYRRSICLYSFWRLWGMCKAETLTFKRARDVRAHSRCVIGPQWEKPPGHGAPEG